MKDDSGSGHLGPPQVCPRCGKALVEVVYGMPVLEMFEAADRGEVVLGGCLLPVEGDAVRSCPCGHLQEKLKWT